MLLNVYTGYTNTLTTLPYVTDVLLSFPFSYHPASTCEVICGNVSLFSSTVMYSRVLPCVCTEWLTSEKPSTDPLPIKRALTISGGPMKAGSLIQDQAWWVRAYKIYHPLTLTLLKCFGFKTLTVPRPYCTYHDQNMSHNTFCSSVQKHYEET